MSLDRSLVSGWSLRAQPEEFTLSGGNRVQFFETFSGSFVPEVYPRESDTALVIVDMQYHDAHPEGSFNLAMDKIQPGSMDYFNARTESTTVPSIVRLLDAFRQRGLNVVHLRLGSRFKDYRDLDARLRQWVRTVEARSGIEGIFWTGNPDFAIRAELQPAESEVVVDKTTFGAFNGSDLHSVLTTLGMSNLVFAGISTNCCVESTVRDAAERGYGCIVVDEATADYDELAHRASLRALAFNHARVVATVAELVTALDSHRPV